MHLLESFAPGIRKELDSIGFAKCSMFEILPMMLQRWFFEQRNEDDYQATDFTKTIEGILRDQIEHSRSMKVWSF